MAVATYAPSAKKRQQWEENSKPSQAENCGPTCVTQIANFYRDGVYMKIEATRRLVAPPQTPTTAWQQAQMLTKRGVPATVREIDSVAQLHGLVDSGRRPVVIGVLMSRVPASVRDHPFLGWHAILVLGRAVVNGVVGFWVTDPNFSPPGGIRPDVDKGRKFYPDWVIQEAYINYAPRYSVVPTNLKPLPATAPSTSTRIAYNREMKSIGTPWLRSSPGGTALRTLRVGELFRTKQLEQNGPTYNDWRDGKLRRDWLILTDGKAVAKAFAITNRIL